MNLPTSLIDDVFDLVVGEAAAKTYPLAVPLTQLCRRLTPSARRAGLRKLFLNRRVSVDMLQALLAAHADAARSIRQIVFIAMPESEFDLPSLEQGIAIVSEAPGLTALDVIMDPVQMLAFIRAVGPAMAKMRLERLELDTHCKSAEVGVPEADVQQLIAPHRHRLKEAWLAFNTNGADSQFLRSRFPALRIFTAWHLDVEKVARVVNTSPSLYSLGLHQYKSIVHRFSKKARRRIEVLVLHFDGPDEAATELQDVSLRHFANLFKLTVLNAMLHNHEDFLGSISDSYFDHLGVDGCTMPSYLADVLEGGAMPGLASLHYDAPRELWGDMDDFEEDVAFLKTVCEEREIAFQHDDTL